MPLHVRVVAFMISSAETFDHQESPDWLWGPKPEQWNSALVLVLETVPQLAVQFVVMYLQGIGSSTYGSIEAMVWGQNLACSLLNLVKNLCAWWWSWSLRAARQRRLQQEQQQQAFDTRFRVGEVAGDTGNTVMVFAENVGTFAA
jgi:hypothetical protein